MVLSWWRFHMVSRQKYNLFLLDQSIDIGQYSGVHQCLPWCSAQHFQQKGGADPPVSSGALIRLASPVFMLSCVCPPFHSLANVPSYPWYPSLLWNLLFEMNTVNTMTSAFFRLALLHLYPPLYLILASGLFGFWYYYLFINNISKQCLLFL